MIEGKHVSIVDKDTGMELHGKFLQFTNTGVLMLDSFGRVHEIPRYKSIIRIIDETVKL